MTNYPYVRTWYGLYMGNCINDYRVRDLVRVATNEEAPQTAVYRRMDGTWATIDELTPSQREKLESLVNQSIEE